MPKNGLQTRQLLTETAFRLFKEKGYANVSVSDICNATDVQRGTFYYHFPSKDAIINSFYDNLKAPDQYQSLLVTTENNWLKLWLTMKPSIDWTIEMGSDILTTLFMMALQGGRDPFSPVSELSSRDLMLNIIQNGKEKKHFNIQGNTEDIYHMIRNQIMGIAYAWCKKGGSFDEEKEIHDALVTILQVPVHLQEDATECLKRIEARENF